MGFLTKFSMKNIAAVMIIVAILFGGGLYSAYTLKMEDMPNVTSPTLMITTQYTAPPQDVMELVTKPIEDKIANVGDIDTISSTSNDYMSSIMISFEYSADINLKKQDLESLIQEVSLPADAKTPKVSSLGVTSEAPVYLALYAGEGVSQSQLDNAYEDNIEDSLESLDGLDHIDVIGERARMVDVKLNADALRYYGLTVSGLSSTITDSLTGGPGGSVKIDGNKQMARFKLDLRSTYDIEHMKIQTPSNGTIQLQQIGTVSAIYDNGDFIGRFNDRPAIGIILYTTKNANVVEFSNKVKELTASWKKTNPQIESKLIYDNSVDILSSINSLVREGFVGAFLAAITILLFLRNPRMTLIVLVSIPLSILITLLVIKYFGLTLNTMTIGGLFIAVGRVVDDSIVVIENIFANLQKAQERDESVVLYATKQVGMAITSSTLATVGVFTPMGMISGIIGEFFRPFAITVSVALLSSLLVALTVIPMLAKILVLQSGSIKHKEHDEHGPVMRAYERILSWCLHHRFKTLVIVAIVFVVTIGSTIPFLSVAFLPSSKTGTVMFFTVKLPRETAVQTTDSIVKNLEKTMKAAKTANGEPLFTLIEPLVGYDDDDENASAYAAQIYVQVNDKADADQVKKEYQELLAFELPNGSKVEGKSFDGGVSSIDFSYYLVGDNQTNLEKAAAMVVEKLQTHPELSEIEDSMGDKSMELDITVDQQKARKYGLNTNMIRQTTAGWLGESQLDDVKINGDSYDIRIGLRDEDKTSVSKVRQIPLTASAGEIIHLEDVALVEQAKAPSSLKREDREQVVNITAKINDKNKNGVSTRLSAELSQLELPDGVSQQVKGVSADINESFTQLGLAMVVGILAVYLVMVISFGNASAPFAILFSLPLAAIGGLLGLVISGESLTVTSMIGFMMLIGIVVTNAIVLLDRAQQMREEGHTVRQALMEAGIVRLRPIIMTAGATVVALIPMALGDSEGGLVSKGLAVVVIGGLLTSTVLTLVVVPIVYELIASFKARMSRLLHREAKAKELGA